MIYVCISEILNAAIWLFNIREKRVWKVGISELIYNSQMVLNIVIVFFVCW